MGRGKYISCFTTMCLCILLTQSTLLLISSNTVYSSDQSNEVITFSKTYSIGEVDWSSSIIETSDGGYIITGGTRAWIGDEWIGDLKKATSDSDMLLIKTDEEGNEIWNQTYGGKFDDSGYLVFEMDDGGYMIFGKTSSFGTNIESLWVLRTDINGNEQWNRTYYGTSLDTKCSAVRTEQDGLIILGEKSNHGIDEDIITYRINRTGSVEWNRTFQRSNHDSGSEIITTNDGGYAIVGRSSSYGKYSSSAIWLIKLNRTGSEEWDRTYSRYDVVFGNTILEPSDGGFIIVGRAHSTELGSGGTWIIKTDDKGDMLWDTMILDGSSNAILELNDGGFLLGTSTYDSKIGLTNIDQDGAVAWQKEFGEGEVSDVIQTTDGGFIVSGYSYSDVYADKILLFKTNSEGEIDEIQYPSKEPSQEGSISIVLILLLLLIFIVAFSSLVLILKRRIRK